MENKVLKLGGRSTKDVYAEIRQGNSERWTIQSQKSKYVNGKLSGISGVGYTASINNSDYLLEEDKSNNEIQITAQNDGTSGLCIHTPILSSRFNPTKKYPLDLNFYWIDPKLNTCIKIISQL